VSHCLGLWPARQQPQSLGRNEYRSDGVSTLSLHVDWITNRADGSYRLDVRLTLKTDDGALILVTYNGIGQTTDAGASLRIAPLFETGDSRYVWLTRLQAVGVGERVGTAVTYDIYALK